MSKKAEDNPVWFVSKVVPEPGSAELHKKSKASGITREFTELRADWSVMTTQILEMVIETDSELDEKSGYTLDEIEIGLAFTAKGKLAFIAEAGAEASIKLTLKRK